MIPKYMMRPIEQITIACTKSNPSSLVIVWARKRPNATACHIVSRAALPLPENEKDLRNVVLDGGSLDGGPGTSTTTEPLLKFSLSCVDGRLVILTRHGLLTISVSLIAGDTIRGTKKRINTQTVYYMLRIILSILFKIANVITVSTIRIT